MTQKTGIITKIYGLYYIVLYEGSLYNCVLRGKLRQNKSMQDYSDPAAVGDIVSIEINGNSGVINEVLPRKNIFSRKEKGKNKKEDIIACNLDLIVIIQAFQNPKLNLRFVDRIILRGAVEDIPVILCINKLDLADKMTIRYIKKYYAKSNTKLYMVSALNGENLDKLAKQLKGNTAILAGTSGVGKTSILNSMYPDLNLRTSEVSKSTNKGRHTTANVEMLVLPDNTYLIDTPGVREFGLMDIEPHLLSRYFNEFAEYIGKCSYQLCTHDHEPGCEIKRQVENGNIFEDRYISYLNILDSLKEYYEFLHK